MPHRILIIDDEIKICRILMQILSDQGYSVKFANSGSEGIEAALSFKPEIILMDQNLPDMSGLETTEIIKQSSPHTIVIMLTAFGSIPLAVEAIKSGAYDYITKPFDNDALLLVIRRALEHSTLAAEVAHLRNELREKYSFENIIGSGPAMQRLFEAMKRVCDTNATVLIQGESGTGKELIARSLHYRCFTKSKPLVVINCGAIPVNLIESELFGHEKGSFTDARERKTGKFEQADGGTLFFDEIGELPLESQVKLLRVLDEKRITRIGGSESIPIDVRIISATNKDLEQEVRRGTFRLDLYYRLNVFTLFAPPLRERKEDIPLLVEHFVQKYNKLYSMNVTSISKSAMDCIRAYDWPGNIRDLENAVQSAMILSSSEVIHLEHLPLRLRGYPELAGEEELEQTGLEASVKSLSSKIEREIIQKTLKKFNNNRTHAADYLKISRKTLFNKMKELGLE